MRYFFSVSLAGLAMTATAFATTPDCRYESFRPAALQQYILGGFGAAGLVTASCPRDSSGQVLNPAGLTVVRDRVAVATIGLGQDALHGRNELVIADIAGAPIFRAVETVVASPPGLSRRIDINSRLQGARNGQSAFSVVVIPLESRPAYYRYGVQVDALTFDTELDAELRWLTEALRTATATRALAPLTEKEQLLAALASEPLLAPYLPRLKFVKGSRGWTVYGVVPSTAVFGLIVNRAADYGFLLHPELIIDTGSRIVPPMTGPGACPRY